jgi:hypothetical protein
MNAPEATALAEVQPLTFATLPALGAALAGGVFVGLTTDKQGRHHAVALLPDKPANDDELTWKKAMAWAKDVGGELPQRPVSALLFANARDQFDRTWYWTGEEFDGAYAWYQGFGDGLQSGYRKDYACRARAVRLIQLTA